MYSSAKLSQSLKGPHKRFSYYGLTVPKANHPLVQGMKKQISNKEVLGHHIWPASYLLIDYLAAQKINTSQQWAEIGCGWGLASTFLNKTYGLSVTAIDQHKEVFGFLRLIQRMNDSQVAIKQSSYQGLINSSALAKDLVDEKSGEILLVLTFVIAPS